MVTHLHRALPQTSSTRNQREGFGKAATFLFSLCLTSVAIPILDQQVAHAAPESGTAGSNDGKAKDGAPIVQGEKVLWDRLEPPDLPKGKPTAEPTAEKREPASPEAKEQEILNLKREVEILKDRVSVLEKKVNDPDLPIPSK